MPTDSPIVVAMALLDQAKVLAELGETDRAAVAADAARAYFEGKGHRPGVRQAAILRAGLTARPGTAGRTTEEG
jgi:hypothetical protein